MLYKWQAQSSAITKYAKKRTMEEKMFLIVLRQESFIWDTVFKPILKQEYGRRRHQEIEIMEGTLCTKTSSLYLEKRIVHSD